MSPGEIWSRLGLAPTTDRSAIRRAYAARLKQVNPEDDPAGFMALRVAYDAALAGAAPVAIVTGEDREIEPPEPSEAEVLVEPAPGPAPAPARRSPILARISERAPHDQLIVDLRGLLQAGAEPRAQLAALEALLALPTMEQLSVQIRIEAALAELITSFVPVSDPLVAPVAETFGWTADGEATAENEVFEAVARRRTDLQRLAQLRDGPDGRALAMLGAPPNGRTVLQLSLRLGLATRLSRLIGDLRNNHPGLSWNVAPGALDAWAERLRRPRLSAAAVWTVLAGAIVAGLFTAERQADAGPAGLGIAAAVMLGTAAGGIGLLAAHCLVVQWPRWLWLNRWSATADAWAAYGWVLLAAITFALGFALPAAPWAMALTGLGAAAVTLWSWTTGRRFAASPSLFQPMLRWPGRNAGLAALLWLRIAHGDSPSGIQAALAVAGPALATGFAEADLARFWTQACAGPRRKVALALLSAAAGGVTVWAAREANSQTSPALLAAITLLALAQRLPAATAPPMRREVDLGAHPRLVLLCAASCAIVLSSVGKAATGLVALALPAGALIGLVIAWSHEPPLRLWPLRRTRAD